MTRALWGLVFVAGATGAASVGQEPGPRVALQRLPAAPAGVASLDVSADGRFVAFVSSARLAAADVNELADIYVLDRSSGRISLESVAVDGGAANGTSAHPRLSADGRYLVFTSIATNLVAGMGGPRCTQVLRRDRDAAATALVSHTPADAPGNGGSVAPEVSDDGRFVAFESAATDLVAGPDANFGAADIYLFDARLDAVSRVSLTSAGAQSPIGSSWMPAISGTGEFVVFVSTATLDALDDTRDGARQPQSVFLRDVVGHTTRRVSRTRDGGVPNGASFSPAISADARRVAFASTATDLGDVHATYPGPQVYLYDRASDRVTLVSRTPKGGAADGASDYPVLSADGRYVVFSSDASNLLCAGRCSVDREDVNLVSDVYRFDALLHLVQRVSGAEPGGQWWQASAGPAVDATGGIIAYSSQHPIDDADDGHDDDLFIELLPQSGHGPASGTAHDPFRPIVHQRDVPHAFDCLRF